MKKLEEIEVYYEREILPKLSSFRVLMNMSKYIIIVTLIAFANFFIGIGGDTGLIVSGVITAIGFLLMYIKTQQMNTLYRDKIVLPLLKQVEDEHFSFNYDGEIQESKIRKSKHFYFAENYTLSQNKLLLYKEENRTIEMLNVKVTNTTRYADNEISIVSTEGLFVVVPTKMNIEGTTLVLADIAERVAGYAGELVQSKKMEDLKQIRLDSPDFEKEFIVYGDDEVVAHYLLNHTVMEVLSEMGKKYLFRFQISFVDGEIFLFFPFAGGWLEPKVHIDKQKEDMLSFDAIRTDLEVIYSVIETVKRIEKHHLV